jgi:Protein of unknown function (DUF1553)/Protein of unknown function (DUF1549)
MMRSFFLIFLVSAVTIDVLAIETVESDVKQFDETALVESDRDHWAFQSLRPSTPPITQNRTWSRSPIDPFILARLEAKNLTPAAAAEKLELLRRVKLNLLGLPPTIEEQNAFQGDESDEAYERIVDQYLASPRYGERWAQIWLDLARFAETDGFEHDRVRSDAWQYRDWVIRSLNEDLPYDQFVYQQLAGDLNEEQTQPIATMFCLAGPDMPDINDQALRRHDRLNELISTIGSSLLGLQFQCAQCHDHKVDPISQADFYRLRAVFEPSVPELKRDKPFNVFTSETNSEPSRFHFRGDLQKAGPVVQAAFPRIANSNVGSIQYCQSETPRAEFARWLFHADNPLPARVIVNRIWQSHFGRGLFDTPSDVGLAVAGPTHPELLDWLAAELRRKQWSLKSLHRTILLSSTYRQGSLALPNDDSWVRRIEVDPRNELYSRFPRYRLEAEVIRDSMLAITGQLHFEAGGEGVMPPLPEELVGTLLKGQWKSSTIEADHYRRSIYLFARRNLRYPIFESFDRPEANASCAKRDLSTTAIQALQMLNSQLSFECSRQLCKRILNEDTLSTDTESSKENSYGEKKINQLYRVALSRHPSSDERKTVLDFLGNAEVKFEDSFLAVCLAIINTNEFIYID